nr:hypothetical protein [Tanacetum cinerariifolium]
MSNTNNNLQTQTSNTLHNAIMEAGSKDRPPMLAPDKEVPISKGSHVTRTKRYQETYKNVSQDIRDQLNAEAEVVQIILTGIDNDIYSTVDACPNACEMWKAIERLKQEWQRFVTLVKQSQELKTVSYHKLYDILKHHLNEVNEIRAERIAHTANLLALVAQQQPVYHPQTHPTHYTQNSSTRSQQPATRNRGKAIVNSPQPIYDQEPSMVTEDDETAKDKEIDKLMALISLSFKKIYKPTKNNLRTSSNTSRANQDHSPWINRSVGYENQRIGNVAGAKETVEQANWRDDTDDDELEDQELEAHYMYTAQFKEVSPDAADSGPIFDVEPVQKNDDNNDLDNERELLASLIEKLKCEIDESKNHNKFLEISNKVLIEKLKGEIEDFKNKNKILESSNNHFKEANNKLSETNNLMYTDFKKSQAELARQIKNKLSAHQETISILSQQKEAQIKLYKTREDKELDKVIASENKVKVLDNIVYKTGQTVQTMNMLNNKCRTSFAKPEFLKKAQRVNPRLYDIGCYNDNLALMLAPESDEVIRLEKESRSKLRDLIRPFDYEKLNNLHDLFVPQREKSSKQRYFSEKSRLSHTPVNNGNSRESFNKQTTLLEKRMDESIPWDQKCKSSIELFKIKSSVGTIFDGVERCKETIAHITYSGYLDPFIQNTIEANFSHEIRRINAGLEQFYVSLNEEMVVDLRYFNSLELEEYYYVDHMNVILGVYTELDEVTNLQFDYLELLEKCKCLEKELSKSNMMSKSFEALQKHTINLEINLQQCQEKIKNDKSFKENLSKEFHKEREQYFEIQDLKAQLQDKGIVISELKKLISNLKGKSMDTKFEKSSIIRQPDAFKSQRPSVLGKPTIFSNSLERKDFSKSKSVTQNCNAPLRKEDRYIIIMAFHQSIFKKA